MWKTALLKETQAPLCIQLFWCPACFLAFKGLQDRVRCLSLSVATTPLSWTSHLKQTSSTSDGPPTTQPTREDSRYATQVRVQIVYFVYQFEYVALTLSQVWNNCCCCYAQGWLAKAKVKIPFCNCSTSGWVYYLCRFLSALRRFEQKASYRFRL